MSRLGRQDSRGPRLTADPVPSNLTDPATARGFLCLLGAVHASGRSARPIWHALRVTATAYRTRIVTVHLLQRWRTFAADREGGGRRRYEVGHKRDMVRVLASRNP